MQLEVYTGGEPLMVLFDLQDPVQRRAFYAHRTAFRERTCVETVDERFCCLYILRGVGELRS